MKATVRMTLSVELEVSGEWSMDGTAREIRAQAMDAAREALRKGLVIEGPPARGDDNRVRAHVLDSPEITIAMVTT